MVMAKTTYRVADRHILPVFRQPYSSQLSKQCSRGARLRIPKVQLGRLASSAYARKQRRLMAKNLKYVSAGESLHARLYPHTILPQALQRMQDSRHEHLLEALVRPKDRSRIMLQSMNDAHSQNVKKLRNSVQYNSQTFRKLLL